MLFWLEYKWNSDTFYLLPFISLFPCECFGFGTNWICFFLGFVSPLLTQAFRLQLSVAWSRQHDNQGKMAIADKNIKSKNCRHALFSHETSHSPHLRVNRNISSQVLFMKVAPSFEKVLITIIKKTVLINVTCRQTYCIFLCMNQPFMTSFSVPNNYFLILEW